MAKQTEKRAQKKPRLKSKPELEKKADEKRNDVNENQYGGFPDRDLKKSLGCG